MGPKQRELRKLAAEAEDLTKQRAKTTRMYGQGDPAFLPYIDRRLKDLEPKIAVLTKEVEEEKKKAKAIKATLGGK